MKKIVCIKLVIYKDYTRMHGQKSITFVIYCLWAIKGWYIILTWPGNVSKLTYRCNLPYARHEHHKLYRELYWFDTTHFYLGTGNVPVSKKFCCFLNTR